MLFGILTQFCSPFLKNDLKQQEEGFINDEIRKSTLGFGAGLDTNLNHFVLSGWVFRDLQKNNGDKDATTSPQQKHLEPGHFGIPALLEMRSYMICIVANLATGRWVIRDSIIVILGLWHLPSALGKTNSS